jgi:putative transposase
VTRPLQQAIVAERRRLGLSHPFIRPQTIVMDKGKVFIPNVFIASPERHKVHVVTSAPHRPTDKPLIERHFQLINALNRTGFSS